MPKPTLTLELQRETVPLPPAHVFVYRRSLALLAAALAKPEPGQEEKVASVHTPSIPAQVPA